MQSQTTEEFAATRIRAILAQIKLLQHELSILRKLKQSFTAEAKLEVLGIHRTSTPRRSGGVTFQDMIIQVLNDQPNNGAEALKILDLIEEKFNKKIQRSSISPQLSRLKGNGVLELKDNVWSLTEAYKAKKQEAPVVGASADEASTSSDNSGATQTGDFEDEIPF